MAIVQTEVQKKILNRVVQNFLSLKKSTSEEELLDDFEDPNAIDILVSTLLLERAQGNNFLPAAISFEFCGDPEVQALTRRGVRAVAHVFRKLIKEKNPSLAPADIERKARDFDSGIDEKMIRVGLYVAPELRLLVGHTGRNDQQVDVIPVHISKYIYNMKLDMLWDDFIRRHNVPAPSFEEEFADPLEVFPMSVFNSVQIASDANLERPPQKEETDDVSTIPKMNSENPRAESKPDWLPKGWRIIDSLPEGGQGWTYRVKRTSNTDQTIYVLKRLKNRKRLSRFRKEIEALKKLFHPGILRIIETFDEEPIYIAEYCEKGDLGRLDLSGMTLLTKLRLYREVCDAIAVAHRANIIHRDIKPQNILMRSDRSIAVGDFGLCLDLDDLENRPTSSSEAVGPRHYIAPELEDGRDADPKPSSDCYSLGKLLYFLISGRSFARERHTEAQYDLRNKARNPQLHFVYELFDKTITTRVNDRYQNAEALVAALDSVLLRIEEDANVLDLQVPQHCLYCRIGTYELRLYTPGQSAGLDAFRVGNPFDFWGNNYMGQRRWMILVCMNCGNTQSFRPDLTNRVAWKNLR